MSHARIVLQAVGSQDAFLTKNSKHTHFKKTHRNHTQFGLDWSIINANDKNLRDYASPNSSHYFRLENNGDLINEIYLRIKINIDDGWSKSNFGNYETIFNIIDNVEFLYNDKTLTKLTSDFIFSYFEINYTKLKKKIWLICSHMINYQRTQMKNIFILPFHSHYGFTNHLD